MVVARGPSFFNLLFRKAGGWIVSRRLRTAWMEGMLASRGQLAVAVAGGCPPFFGGSPPYNYEAAATRASRRAAALPKEPVTPLGRQPPRAKPALLRLSLDGGYMV